MALLLLVVVLALALAVRRSGRRQDALADRVAALEAALAERGERAAAREPHPAEPAASYVITGITDPDDDRDGGFDDRRPDAVPGRIDRAVFADIVAREGVIKAAGLAHGLRRAMAPEARNRIRFEVRREVKRSRRQRRSDLKAALRDLQARERARMAGARDEGDAA
ncbi:hypothetical protein ASG94_01325 [Nocardioides sp. Soil805]|nr:hypothetical protein ASG94_01325 [Nocardioides sp. Soil805]